MKRPNYSPVVDVRKIPIVKQKKTKLPGKRVKTAGIIGGLAPQSTSLFYDTITQICLDRQLPAYPRMLINSVNTWAVTSILEEKNMNGLYAFLRKEVGLIQDQVDFIVMVCNSVHAVLDPLRKAAKVPVLSICEVVCKAISSTSIKKVGILGTKTTMDNCFYQQELSRMGIEYVTLPAARETTLDKLIFEKVLYGREQVKMRALILESIQYLQNQGCEGVILACTELPLFVKQEDTEMPLFLSTQILAEAVVEACFGSLGRP